VGGVGSSSESVVGGVSSPDGGVGGVCTVDDVDGVGGVGISESFSSVSNTGQLPTEQVQFTFCGQSQYPVCGLYNNPVAHVDSSGIPLLHVKND